MFDNVIVGFKEIVSSFRHNFNIFLGISVACMIGMWVTVFTGPQWLWAFFAASTVLYFIFYICDMTGRDIDR